MLKIDPTLLDTYDGSIYRTLRESEAEPVVSTGPKGKKYFSDIPNKVGLGIVGLAKGGVNLVGGEDTGIYKFLESEIKRGQGDLSPEMRRQDEARAAVMADPETGMLDVVASMAENPYSTLGDIAGSIPGIFAGGGVGGLLMRGTAAATGAAVGRFGGALASGVGEGTIMAVDVLDKTKSVTAALEALALGTVTGGLTPGNVVAKLGRKTAGDAAESAVLPAVFGVETATLGRTGVKAAVGRGLATTAEEAAQEYVQEFGQSAIEQYATEGSVDFNTARKAGAAGAVMGGVMGGGMHPVVGEGSQQAQLEMAEKVLEKDPTNPVAQAEVSLLRAQRDYVEATPDQRAALKPAIDVAQAAVVAARNPESRDAQENLDTAKAEVVVDTAGMEGARAAADSVSIETKRAIEEATTTDEVIQAFAEGQQAHSTLTVDAQAVANTRAGMAQVIPEVVNAALEEEVARASAPLASGTVNQETFPVEEVATPKVSDQVGLTRDTPVEVAQAQIAEAEAVPLPVIDTEALATEVQAITAPRVAAAKQALAEAGMVPDVARILLASTDAALRQQYAEVGADPARIQMAEALLEQRGVPVAPEARAARAVLEAEVQTLAQAVGRTPASLRQLLQRVTEQQARNNLNNPTLAQQHPTMRALGVVRGWDLTPEVEEITASEIEEPVMGVDQGMVNELNAERLLTRTGTVELSDRLNDLVVDNAPDEVVEAMMSVSRFTPGEAEDSAIFAEDSAAVLNWLQSEEGATVGGLRYAGQLNRVRDILGLRSIGKTESASTPADNQLEAMLREAKAAPDEVIDRDAKIAELERMAGDITMTPVQRRGYRAQAANLRTERAAEATANTPTARGTRAGVRSVQRNFETRAQAAKSTGTLQKMGKFWRNMMSSRNVGQRTLPKIDTSNLKTSMRAAVASGRALPQAALTEIKNRYNAKLRAMAEKWAATNGANMATWVDPIISLTPQYEGRSAGFSMQLHGLGRGDRNENPYAARPTGATAYFSADSTIHASSLRSAPGAADLAYRIAAEVAALRGIPFPSDQTLTTVNPLRRQLQSLSSDTLFAPGTINPLTSGGRQGPQGVPPEIWSGLTPVEKVGLNALRAAHSISETRANSPTAGEWLENLEFDRQGRIVAVTDPKPIDNMRTGVRTPFGFPRGTFVTDRMLKDKIGEINPATGYTTFAQESHGTGGIGVDTAKLGILNNTILNFIENNPEAEIPAWMGTVARSTGRAMGGWFFSENEDTPATGITPAEATQHLRDVVGDKAAQVLLDTGLVRFVETPAELADLGGVPLSSVSGAVQGATLDDGSIVLVVGSLSGKTAAAVLQHEALHATLKGLLGEDTYTRLMDRLDTLLQAGGQAQWVKDARAAVPANTPAENVTEEVAGYAVEQYVKNPESTNPIVAWARNLMSAIRTAIIQNKSLPEALRVWAIQNIQPQDFARMAIAGLKKSATTQGSMRESRRDFDGEIAALMEEHKGATPERRAEINGELRTLNQFRNAAADIDYEENTNEPANLRGENARVPAKAEYGTAREGAVSIDATHFSNTERTSLNTSAYGRGAKGEEAGRLALPENADIRDRTHFYVNEGAGVTPESAVGGVAHNVKLNNMYDIKADKLGIRAAAGENVSAMERAVVAAGFDGYYAPQMANKQGVAVVIGKHSIPVSAGQGGTNLVTQFEGDTYAANLAKSKLPGGSMLGREWLASIKGTEFDTANVRAELEVRQGERLYRDDLPRFNKPSNGNMKFSIAQEANHAVTPVAPSPAPRAELNVLDNPHRGPVERVMEMVRGVLQDKHTTLRRLQQLAGVTVDQIKMDTMGALDRLGSKMATKQRSLVMEPLAAMENILQANYSGPKADEEAYRDINQLLKMRHVAEYNARMALINPAKYDANGIHLTGHDAANPGSGITDEVAAAEVARLEAGPHAKALLEAEKTYRKMIHDLQDYAVAQGLETAGLIEAWRDPETGFPNYTPFHRELDLDENFGIGTTKGGQAFSLRTGITQRAMGSKAEIVDPLASTLILGTRIVRRGENAVVARTMFEFAKDVIPNYLSSNGELKPMWSVDVVPQTRVLKRVNIYKTRMANGEMSPEFYNREQARLYADAQQTVWVNQNPDADPTTSGIQVDLLGAGERVFSQPIPDTMNRDNIMVIPVKGENHIITFDEGSADGMAILRALKGKDGLGAGAKAASKLLTPFRMFSRWTVAMATGYNPMFMPFNSIRDVFGSMINARDGGVPGWTWKDSRQIATQFPAAFAGINARLHEEFLTRHSNTGAAPEAEPDSWGWWMDQAERAGGMTGVMEHIAEPEEARTMLRRLYGSEVEAQALGPNEVKDWLSRGQNTLLKLGDKVYKFGEGETKGVGEWASKQIAARIKRFNSASEAATRTMVFRKATERYMDQGHSQAEAMQLAAVVSKNISTNFNRRGSFSTALNQMFPFFNAAVQGSARLAEALFEKETYTINKDSHVITDQRTRITPFGKNVIKGMASIGAAQAALLFAAGFDDDEPPQSVKDRNFIVPLGDKKYLMIPMPHGFNTLVNFGREMTQTMGAAASGNFKQARKHFNAATLGQISAFNPFGGQGGLGLTISPALSDPAIALYFNEDAFGRPIAREDFNPRNQTPGFTRTKEGGSTSGRAVAQLLNSISGGNEDQPGGISPTGDQIDYLLGELGGGLTREVLKAGKVGWAGVEDVTSTPREELPVSKVPLIGRLYGEAKGAVGIRTRAFEVSGELNQLNNRYKGLMERAAATPDAAEKEALRQKAREFKADNPEISLADDFNRFYTSDSKAKKQRALARGNSEVGKVNRITESQTEKATELLEKYDLLAD